MPNLDLDVDAPEKVAKVLRDAAQSYRESHGDLQAAWQDRNAGRVWLKIASRLERAATALDKLEY